MSKPKYQETTWGKLDIDTYFLFAQGMEPIYTDMYHKTTATSYTDGNNLYDISRVKNMKNTKVLTMGE